MKERAKYEREVSARETTIKHERELSMRESYKHERELSMRKRAQESMREREL